jgi:hypothetical protein
MYAFAGRAGIVPEGTNPARGIDKFRENRHERFLTGEELAMPGMRRSRVATALFSASSAIRASSVEVGRGNCSCGQ